MILIMFKPRLSLISRKAINDFFLAAKTHLLKHRFYSISKGVNEC